MFNFHAFCFSSQYKHLKGAEWAVLSLCLMYILIAMNAISRIFLLLVSRGHNRNHLHWGSIRVHAPPRRGCGFASVEHGGAIPMMMVVVGATTQSGIFWSIDWWGVVLLVGVFRWRRFPSLSLRQKAQTPPGLFVFLVRMVIHNWHLHYSISSSSSLSFSFHVLIFSFFLLLLLLCSSLITMHIITTCLLLLLILLKKKGRAFQNLESRFWISSFSSWSSTLCFSSCRVAQVVLYSVIFF